MSDEPEVVTRPASPGECDVKVTEIGDAIFALTVSIAGTWHVLLAEDDLAWRFASEKEALDFVGMEVAISMPPDLRKD